MSNLAVPNEVVSPDQFVAPGAMISRAKLRSLCRNGSILQTQILPKGNLVRLQLRDGEICYISQAR